MGKFNLAQIGEKTGVEVIPEKNAVKPEADVKQGDAGKKTSKMMNIRFTKENADYLRYEGMIRGMNMTAFVNAIIQEYRSNPDNVHENPFFKEILKN